jgi:predicted metal-dependent hydrolase
MPGTMSKKSAKIAERVAEFQGQRHSPYYLGYFKCFNAGQFYEAHDVLEELWLADRQGANGAFYKGLIQLAGAFVHLQKQRLKPAAALFRLAMDNLIKYPERHEDLNTRKTEVLIIRWLADLEGCDYEVNPLNEENHPYLTLQ